MMWMRCQRLTMKKFAGMGWSECARQAASGIGNRIGVGGGRRLAASGIGNRIGVGCGEPIPFGARADLHGL